MTGIKITKEEVKTAGKICCILLRKLNISVVAAGDNNPRNVDGKLYDIPVQPLSEIAAQYPNALVVLGSFLKNVSDSIVRQLRAAGKNFAFCSFDEIGYLYEIQYLKRKHTDRLEQIIKNVTYDDCNIWKRIVHTGVIPKYFYELSHNQTIIPLLTDL